VRDALPQLCQPGLAQPGQLRAGAPDEAGGRLVEPGGRVGEQVPGADPPDASRTDADGSRNRVPSVSRPP
jgi:hypothetical protein